MVSEYYYLHMNCHCAIHYNNTLKTCTTVFQSVKTSAFREYCIPVPNDNMVLLSKLEQTLMIG